MVHQNEIDCIIAGIPCQGHSLNNVFPNSKGSQMKNAEIVVFLSYIELCRPKYAIMENVKNIANSKARDNSMNVLFPAMRALTEMGYQVF
jgi:DNA (cytosine-5)-methyltransferase 1